MLKTFSSVIAAIMVLVCCLLATSATADAPADAVKYVKLVQTDTGKVLSVADNSDQAGAKVAVAKDDASETQQWKVEKDGDALKIVNRKTGKVLDAEGESTDDGAAVIQWDDKTEHNDNQRWTWEGTGDDRRLKNKATNMVVDVGDNGMVIQHKADDKAKGQLWKIVEVK